SSTLAMTASSSAAAACPRKSAGLRVRKGGPDLAVLLEHAAIHGDEQARLARPERGRLVDHALLHPDGREAERDRLVHVAARLGALAEDVGHVDGEGNL